MPEDLMPEIRASLGQPVFRFAGDLDWVAWDPKRALVMLGEREFVAVNDLAAGCRLTGFESDAPPFRLAVLYQGDVILVEGDGFVRRDIRTDRRRGPKTRVKTVAAAMSRKGGVLACLDDRGRLRTFDARTGKERRGAGGAFKWAKALALSSDGKWALLSSDAELGVVEVASSKERWRIPTAGPAAFMDPQRVVVVDRDKDSRKVALRVIGTKDGRALERTAVELQDGTDVTIAGGPDGRSVAFGTRAGVEVWALGTRWQRRFVAALDGPARPFFRDDGVLLAVTWGALLAWDLARKGAPLIEDAPVGMVEKVLVAGETVLALGAGQRAFLWRPATGARRVVKRWNTDAFALCPDGTLFAAHEGQRVVVRRSSDGAFVRRLGTFQTVQCLAWGGANVAVKGYAGEIRVIDAKTGRSCATFPPPAKASQLELSPDGRRLAVGVWDRPPRLWDLPSQGRLPSLEFKPLRAGGDPLSFAFTRNGDEVVVGANDGALHRFDSATGRLLGAVPTKAVRALHLAVSADGRLAAIASLQEAAVHLAQLADGKEIAEYVVEGGASALGFRSDGDLVVAAGDGTVQVWSLPAAARGAPVPKSAPGPQPSKAAKGPALARPRALPRTAPARALLRRGEMIGWLACPSGRLAVGDPYSINDARCVLPQAVPTGAHPVFALIEEEFGIVEAYALLVQLGRGKAVRWRSALPRGHGAVTDSATLAVADAATAAGAFDEIDGEELVSSAVLRASVPRPGVTIVGTKLRNLALLHLGSDGGYPVRVGLDARRRPVALAVGRDLDRLKARL